MEPSWSLRRHLRIEKRICHGWPVFILAPRTARSDHRVLYLHGGAYVHGPFGAHWRLISRLIQRTRAQVTMPLYPLAPRHTWRDAFSLLGHVYAEMASQQNTANITFTGDSAGGGLALAFAQLLREKAQPLPGKLVLLSPWLDVTFSDPKQLELAGIDRMLATPGPRWAGRCGLATFHLRTRGSARCSVRCRACPRSPSSPALPTYLTATRVA